MCVLTLSCLHSRVSFTLTLCSGSSPSLIAGRAWDYRSEDIHEFSLFEIINCAHLKFTVYASKQANSKHHTHALASFPGSCTGQEEREPGTHCSRMRWVPLITCIILRYTKITVNSCLPAERPHRTHCIVTLPVGHTQAVLKSQTISICQ